MRSRIYTMSPKFFILPGANHFQYRTLPIGNFEKSESWEIFTTLIETWHSPKLNLVLQQNLLVKVKLRRFWTQMHLLANYMSN